VLWKRMFADEELIKRKEWDTLPLSKRLPF